MSTDPFSVAYDAIVDAIYANASVTALVTRAGNRLRHDEERFDKQKMDLLQSADTPELDIIPTGIAWRHMSSDSWEAIQRLSVRVTTGDLRIDERMYAITYALLKACAVNDTSIIATAPTVMQIVGEPVNWGQSRDDAELNRGTIGWTTVATIAVQHILSKATLTA